MDSRIALLIGALALGLAACSSGSKPLAPKTTQPPKVETFQPEATVILVSGESHDVANVVIMWKHEFAAGFWAVESGDQDWCWIGNGVIWRKFEMGQVKAISFDRLASDPSVESTARHNAHQGIYSRKAKLSLRDGTTINGAIPFSAHLHEGCWVNGDPTVILGKANVLGQFAHYELQLADVASMVRNAGDQDAFTVHALDGKKEDVRNCKLSVKWNGRFVGAIDKADRKGKTKVPITFGNKSLEIGLPDIKVVEFNTAKDDDSWIETTDGHKAKGLQFHTDTFLYGEKANGDVLFARLYWQREPHFAVRRIEFRPCK